MILSPTAFESFFNQYVHPALLLDSDGPRHTVLAASDAFLKATHQTRENLVGKGFFETFEKESRSREILRLRTAIDAVLETGKPHATAAYQYNFEREDGSVAIRYWNLDTRLVDIPGTEGSLRKIIAHTAFDVTDQVLVQKIQSHLLENSELHKIQMAEERHTLQRLVDSKRVGAFTLAPVRDEAGMITDFRFLTITAMLRKQMEKDAGNQNLEFLSQLRPQYPQEEVFKYYEAALQNQKGGQFDYSCRMDKADRWFQVTVTYTENEELLITIIDQTEIKQIQQRLEQTIEELRRTNANLEDFAYAASHDLQEPLRKIQTFSAMLQTRCENALDAPSLALLARMQSATVRMRTLIEDLLQYSRLSLGSEAFKEVSLKDLLQELLSENTAELSACNASIDFQGLENVCGVRGQLKLLFKHLLDNAFKFSHEGRPLSVNITGRRVRPGEENLELAEARGAMGDYLRIDFEDNGIGFEPEYAERVFQLFQRLHGRSETTGTGMGLAMVEKIVTNHKGMVKALGRPGEGATFTFWLPFAEKADCS